MTTETRPAAECDHIRLNACTITWHEDDGSGRCYFVADFGDDRHEMPEENVAGGGPISASSDALAIAEAIASDLSLDVVSVDHDGDCIHATMRQR